MIQKKIYKKGTISIGGLGVLFLELAVFVIFLPQITSFITVSLPFLQDYGQMGVWLVRLIPLALVMAITFSVFKKDQQIGAG